MDAVREVEDAAAVMRSTDRVSRQAYENAYTRFRQTIDSLTDWSTKPAQMTGS